MSASHDTTTVPDELVPTRYSLLSRLVDWGDEESWQVFFETYWRLIYSVALKSGLTQAEAEDVVQETVICVAKNIQKFKRDRKLGSFKGWLRNLTRWRIADQLKRRTEINGRNHSGTAQKNPWPEEIPDPVDESATADWDREWHSHLLNAAKQRVKRRVKEEQYQLFDLYVNQQWPVARIRQALAVSATQIYLAKHRITRLLRAEVRRLEKEWEAG